MANWGNDHINIHAHMIAFNESFTIQFWQNSTALYWNDWQCNDPDDDGICAGADTYRGDGRGDRYDGLTGSNDTRGIAFVWGGMVQLFRGYMLRNAFGPYNITPGVGMDKNYYWDDNQRCNVLPLYPEAENCNEECENNKVPEQYNFDIGQFRIF